MKNKLTLFFATIAWFAVLAQYYLMIENRVASFSETTIRFFSFFTILSNTLVAIYFTVLLQYKQSIHHQYARYFNCHYGLYKYCRTGISIRIATDLGAPRTSKDCGRIATFNNSHSCFYILVSIRRKKIA
jgi:hypothetical protein